MLIFLGHWFLLRNYKIFGVCENADGLDRTCRVQMANALSQNIYKIIVAYIKDQ